MKRITLHLSYLHELLKHLSLTNKFHHFYFISELENINGISLKINDLNQDYQLITTLSSLKFKFLNIYIPYNEADTIRELCKLPINMITLYQSNNEQSDNLAMNESIEHISSDLIKSIKQNGKLSAIQLYPEIVLVKKCAKLEADYLEFDLSHISTFNNYDAEVQYFENFNMALLAAEKLGFGISCSHINNYDYLKYIKDSKQIEEIILGQELIEKSLFNGYQETIKYYINLIKN